MAHAVSLFRVENPPGGFSTHRWRVVLRVERLERLVVGHGVLEVALAQRASFLRVPRLDGERYGLVLARQRFGAAQVVAEPAQPVEVDGVLLHDRVQVFPAQRAVDRLVEPVVQFKEAVRVLGHVQLLQPHVVKERGGERRISSAQASSASRDSNT